MTSWDCEPPRPYEPPGWQCSWLHKIDRPTWIWLWPRVIWSLDQLKRVLGPYSKASLNISYDPETGAEELHLDVAYKADVDGLLGLYDKWDEFAFDQAHCPEDGYLSVFLDCVREEA